MPQSDYGIVFANRTKNMSLNQKYLINLSLIMIRFFLTLSLICCSNLVFSQEKFDAELLQSPKTNGALIANKVGTVEVFEYETGKKNRVFLKNGFRQSSFTNADEWTSIKDTVEVISVEIVYSKYPIRGGIYNEIYPLLFNRIKKTIAMDPDLNNVAVNWVKVQQTNCIDNAQVDGLFHGVVIHYKLKEPEIEIIEAEVELVETSKERETRLERLNRERDQIKKEEEQFEETRASVGFILNSPLLPDSIKETLKTKPLDAQLRYLEDYFKEAEIQSELQENKDLSTLQFLNQVNLFLQGFSDVEPVIMKVLDRHPEWRNKIVINDWTGSMYSYGAQVVEWHLMNLDSSGISTVTLFNDGDNKSTKKKKIGSTGGIYTEKTSNLEELIGLFAKVMANGGGGDGPENDIEAILEAIERQPKTSEIILIADNRACVRDIELAERINRPVRIILCGYDPEEGVNAHYVYLAKKTGGGIYTIQDDIEDMQVTLGERGNISDYQDERIRLKSAQCYSGEFSKISSQVFTLKKARWKKNRVRVLNASYSQLEKLPNCVFDMKHLQILNASNNAIREISSDIERLYSLDDINFSNNQISHLPKEFSQLKYVQYINLSNNNFDTLPEQITGLKFLREVNVSNNNLTEFNNLKTKHLTKLDLSNNELSKLPSLNRHSNLYELNLAGNDFTSVPASIPLTKNLQVLNLANNHITHLPDDLTDYTKLKLLDLTGNDISWAELDRIRKILFYTDVRF
ncbi:MAG: hypothetical protein ACJAUD_001620 [Crocinitomicaceae bacterium]|jgi:hypothetical protein